MKDSYIKSILLTLVSASLLSVIGFLAKFLGKEIYLPFLIFIRFLFPFLIAFIYGLLLRKIKINTSLVKNLSIRAIFVCLSQYAFFFYLKTGTILDGILLFMTSPLFMPILTKITHHRAWKITVWLSILVGFLGVLFILHPSEGIFDWSVLIGLSSGFFNACSQVSFHKMVRKQTIYLNLFYLYFISSIFSGVVLFLFTNQVPWTENIHQIFTIKYFSLLLLLGILGLMNQILRGHAFRLVKRPGDVMPFLYFSVVFSGLFDWIYYHQVPDFWTFLGTVLIVLSGIATIYITKKLRSREISL